MGEWNTSVFMELTSARRFRLHHAETGRGSGAFPLDGYGGWGSESVDTCPGSHSNQGAKLCLEPRSARFRRPRPNHPCQLWDCLVEPASVLGWYLAPIPICSPCDFTPEAPPSPRPVPSTGCGPCWARSSGGFLEEVGLLKVCRIFQSVTDPCPSCPVLGWSPGRSGSQLYLSLRN
jgi:hypothetical protein